jgi:hypothetical protein
VDFRSRANATRGLDFDHMMRQEHKGRYEDRQQTKKKKTKIAFDGLNSKEQMQKL